MKRFLLPITFLLACVSTIAQTIKIDSTLNSPNYIVGAAGVAPNTTKYHVSEAIYTNSEIGTNNFTTAGSAIQEVSFFVYTVGSPTNVSNFKLYMKNVSSATQALTSGTYLANRPTYTLVYNGALNANPVNGMITVTLTTPFVRNAGDNLQILVERTDGIAYPGFAFYCTQGNRSNTALLTARRYNSSGTLSANPSLTASGFRPSIQFKHTYNLDASISSIVNPSVSCFNSNQTIKVTLSNVGISTIPAGAVTVNLKVSGSNTYVGNVSNSNPILVGENEIINFTGVNLNNPGQIFDTASVVYSSDQNALNNLASSTSSTSSILTSYPISEDFETTTPASFPNTEILAGNLNLWKSQTGDYTSYGTLSPRSTGSSYYLYDCYSGTASNGFTSRLFSKCITLPTPASLNSVVSTLSFYMSHDNEAAANNDSLFVCVSTDRGATWARIAGYQRYDATFAIPGWKNELVDLSAYNAQTIQIGFEGVSDFGNIFGIDDINISYLGTVPVTMLSFDAVRAGKSNNLTWTTTNEINFSKFEIERSNNGINYVSIGSVNAIGNSASKQNYRFLDANPAKGNNYYRIKSVDIDNSYKLSVVRNVKNLGFVEMMINPNPVASTMNISLEAEASEKASIIITDLSGRKVYSGTKNVIAGSNNIPVDVNNLNKGIYIVTLRLSGETLIKKITKL
ncbi:MAG: T9SS type A sorting domain-containing protein [Sphingobacteriales bacterium]|nr:T9SS type A sorting domain-containing protein [Sphingobacteriales bacterium]